ncbi:MAG TPA: helix-turn-helix domain-containing protein [Pantanalinema sp.]
MKVMKFVDQEFRTVQQVAEQLAVSQNLIYKLIAEGKIGHSRIGTSIRIPSEALREYLEQQYTEAG